MLEMSKQSLAQEGQTWTGRPGEAPVDMSPLQ